VRVVKFEVDTNLLLLTTDDGQLKLEVISERIIRVVYTRRETFSLQPSLMMLPRQNTQIDWSIEDSRSTLTLKTAQLQLVIQKSTGAFTWLNLSGDLLVREPDTGGKTLEEVPIELAENFVLQTQETADGTYTQIIGGEKRIARQAYSTRLDFIFSDDEAIYGLGQHEEGILNYRGHHQYLYQHNMKVAVPQIVSSRGYAILWDTYALSVFHDDQYGSYFWSEFNAEMDFYFIYGPEFDQIVAGFRALTGQVPLLPRWALGYVQSKECYIDQAELIAVVEAYRERGIPLDCIVQDWKSWTGNLWGQKTFDPDRYPDPAAMLARIHDLNAKLMISIWPRFNADGPNQVEMRDHGFLLGDDTTYNAFDPAARSMYWRQTNEGLFKHGIDAWWCDCTEPYEADWTGVVKKEPWQRLNINTGQAKTFLDPAYINAYSLLHSQGIYEGQRDITSDKRVVNLTRSYSPGQQRYGCITWSGDIVATWDVLRKQIAEGLNFSVTGGGYWTLDIGGFFVDTKDQWFWRGGYPGGHLDEGYRELYVRWFQYGAFLPMFRSHGTDTPREVWRFGEPGDIIYETLVKFTFLRYRLLPYIYSLAAAETYHARTMLRMLAFDFRHDPNVYDIADQYMFGPALMVCPVTKPMYFDRNSVALENIPKTRSVYLPAGADWHDFWTGQPYSGGQVIEAAAPLDILPLYVKAGSILPLGPKVQHTGERLDAPWEIRIYPGADGSFAVYEDEGNSYRYEQGIYSWFTLSWENALGRFTAGPCSGQPGHRELRLVRVSRNHGAGLEPTLQPDHVINYCGETVRADWS
jgi:alpha-D-xyloside xylohydrolase